MQTPKKPAIEGDAILRQVEALRDELFDFAARLVRIPTVNPPGNCYGECAEEIARELEACRFECRLITAQGRPEHSERHPRVNVLARRGGTKDSLPAIHLNGHLDVVPAGEGWTIDPFCGELRAGKLWGRGSADMKAGLACALYATEALRRVGCTLQGTVEVSATVDEETGGHAGVAYLAEQGYLDPAKIGHVIIPEPFSPHRVCVGHRGVYWFKVTTHGRIAHGSMPFLGHSAISDMGAVVAVVDEVLRPIAERLATDLPVVPQEAQRGTININAVWGGQVPAPGDDAADQLQSPCVADVCTLVVDRRFVPEETLDEVRCQVHDALQELAARREGLRYELSEVLTVEPSRTPLDSPLVGALGRAITEVTGREAQLVASPGTYDQKHFDRIAGIPSCVAYGPGELEQAHQPDEWCSLEAMVHSTQVMALAIAELLSGE